jgi:hypothetical protein
MPLFHCRNRSNAPQSFTAEDIGSKADTFADSRYLSEKVVKKLTENDFPIKIKVAFLSKICSTGSKHGIYSVVKCSI